MVSVEAGRDSLGAEWSQHKPGTNRILFELQCLTIWNWHDVHADEVGMKEESGSEQWLSSTRKPELFPLRMLASHSN